MEQKVVQGAILKQCVVPLFAGKTLEALQRKVALCQEFGATVIEVLARDDETIAALPEFLKWAAGEELIVGVGSVSDEKLALSLLYGKHSPQFIVAPGYVHSVHVACSGRDTLYMGGALTPAEIDSRREEGLELIKLYPASFYGGPAGVKGMLSPYARYRKAGELFIMATGGVKPENCSEWLDVVDAVSMSALGDDDEAKARAAFELIQSLINSGK